MATDVYRFLMTLPEHLYPFKNKIEGEWVRGLRSYEHTLKRYRRKYGAGYFGFRLMAYRSFFHTLSSIIFILGATYLTRMFFGSDAALLLLLGGLILFISYQEFVLHRRYYKQFWKKSFIDWFSWTVPVGMYIAFFL